MSDPWDRQNRETSKAYAHFQLYRDLGRDRSLARLMNDGKVTVKRRQVERWSSGYRWVERCEAYDSYLDQQRRKRTEKERFEMADRQANISREFQDLVMKKLQEWALSLPNIRPFDAARMFAEAAKVERQALPRQRSIREEGRGLTRELVIAVVGKPCHLASGNTCPINTARKP